MNKVVIIQLLMGMIPFLSELSAEKADSSGIFDAYSYETPQMGVPFRIILYTDQGKSHADRAASLAWKRIASLNTILSNYETESELSRLGYESGEGIWTKVSDDMWTVLASAQRLSVLSEGAFDMTLGPATALWRKVRREKRTPSSSALDSMWERTGWDRLLMRPEDQSVCLTVSGMRLDPGGIAKGFALDEAVEVLKEQGIPHALISGGGDMAFYGGKPTGDPWQIRLAGFMESSEEGPMIELKNGAVATSGDLFQYVEIDGVRYSHILNPRTGLGLTVRTLTTVIAFTGIQADSLATTLSVLGPRRAPAWTEKHVNDCGVRMLWLDEDVVTREWVHDDQNFWFGSR
jgi:thiamine biosynthesis lipoprotein